MWKRYITLLVLLSMGCLHSAKHWDVPQVFHCVPGHERDVTVGFAWAKERIPSLSSSVLVFDGDGHYREYGQVVLTDGSGGQTWVSQYGECSITCGTDRHIPECIAHELGHCAGMKHIDAPGSLMYWTLPNELVWTAADEQECERDCE